MGRDPCCGKSERVGGCKCFQKSVPLSEIVVVGSESGAFAYVLEHFQAPRCRILDDVDAKHGAMDAGSQGVGCEGMRVASGVVLLKI